MGRDRAAEHPADRLRPAAARRDVQHRHADRRLDRPGDEAGRDVQPAARLVGVPLPPGPLRGRIRARVPRQDQLASSRRSATAPTSFPARRARAASTASRRSSANLYGLDIKYFVEVNFEGFKQVVDALGGVTINVQVPGHRRQLPERHRPASRVYIPAGIQHMTGAQALVYARSRHGSDDFDRGDAPAARPDLAPRAGRHRALIPRIPELLAAVKATVQTDIPQSQLAKLAGLAGAIDTKNIRSYVFSYPRYGSAGSSRRSTSTCPTSRKIRSAVANAFKVDPQLEDTRAALAQENASIWVLNGSGRQGQGVEPRRRSSSTTASTRRRPRPEARARAASVARGRRLQRRRDEADRDDRLPGIDVQDQGRAEERPGNPRRHRDHDHPPDADAHAAADELRAQPPASLFAGAVPPVLVDGASDAPDETDRRPN